MNKLKITLLFLFISGLVVSQKISFDQGKINQKNYYEEISFELVNNKIMLPVVINNKTYRFLLDTGAPNVISKRVLNELNIQNSLKINVSDANNKSDTMELVSVNSIQIGNLNFENNVALVSDLDNHFILKCFQMDGFIGSNLFHKSVVKISLKNKKIIVTNDIKKLNPISKPSKLLLIGQQKSPYIQVDYSSDKKNRVVEEVLIDTGMGGFFEMSQNAFSILSKENVLEEIARATGSSGIGLFGSSPEKEQILFRTSFYKLNQTTFENLIANTTDDNNSRIGLDLLLHGDVIIDFINKKFYFEATDKITLTEKLPVYTATLLDTKYSIGFVWDAALKDILNYGDEIIRVDSFIINEMEFCDVVKIKEFRKNKESYELEVKSKETTETKTVKIEQ
jgi:predicted aspartyl protease